MVIVALLLLSAAAHALLFPPWEQTWLSWLALAPFLWAIRYASPWRAGLYGVLWGHATHWPIASWVMDAVRVYFGQSWLFGFGFGIAASVLFWTPYYGLFAAGASWVMQRTRGISTVLLVAALWVTCELARAHLWVGSTWMLLGYALVPSPLMRQAADLGGVYLLSFAIVLTNALLAAAWSASPSLSGTVDKWRRAGFAGRQGSDKRPAQPALRLGAQFADPTGPRKPTMPIGKGGSGLDFGRAIAVALFPPMLLAAYGAWRLHTPLPAAPAIPVIVVQGNHEPGARWQPGSYGQGLDTYLDLSRRAASQEPARLIVWPEAAVPVFIAREPEYQAQITSLLRETQSELILGAPHFENLDPAVPLYFNSAFVLGADGLRPERYDKQHLMPFTEYFPWHTMSFLRRRFESVRTFTPGTEDIELVTRLGRTAVVICFEADFPDLVRRRMARGAEVLVNLSNDVWLGNGRGQQQHLTMAVLRAVENRTWMIRATTTGISAVVDPYGTIVTQAPSQEAAILRAAVTPMRVATAYKQVGDLFAYSCALFSVTAVALLAIRRTVHVPAQQV